MGIRLISGTLTRVFLPIIPVNWFVRAGIVLAIVALLITGSYFIWFIINGYVPGGPDSWGQFGDYFGGLMNPIVGFATIALLVMTLLKQQEEMHRMISMNEVERLFKLTEKVYEELDEALDYDVGLMVQHADRLRNVSGSDLSKVLRTGGG